MSLLNINSYPPALIRETFSAFEGITPEIADGIAVYLEQNGRFDTKTVLLEVLSELGVEARFVPALTSAIAVLPPLPFPPLFPGFCKDDKGNDEFFEGGGEEITTNEDGEKVKVCCTWKYRINAAKKLTNYGGNVPGFGRIELAPKSGTGELAKVEGSVSWCCKNTSAEGCRPKPFGLDYDLPPAATIGDVSYAFTEAANAVLKLIKKVGVVLTQPALEVVPDIRLTPTDDGACYLVKAIVRLKLTKGKLTISAKGITLLEIDLGEDIKDTFVLTETLCCCRIDGNLDLVKPTDKNVKDNPIAPNEALAPEKCDCGCKFSHISSKRYNPAAGVKWTTKALEGGCRLERVAVTDATGQQGVSRNKKGPAIEPVERDASGAKPAKKGS